mgnify:CR=1 FL=1
MGLLLHVALRSLRSSVGTTVLAVLAVAAGVAFQVPNTANFRGYTTELLRVGLGRRGLDDVRVTASNGEPLPKARGLLGRLEALPFVRGAAARLEYAGVVVRPERAPVPVRVVGIEPAIETRVSAFCGQVERGRCLGPGTEVMLGALLAKQLQVSPGEVLRLMLPVQALGEVEMTMLRPSVVGVMQGTGGFETDFDVFVDRGELARLIDEDDAATELAVFVHERARAAEHARTIAATLPGVTAVAWSDPSSFVARAVSASETLLRVSSAMVVVAVGVPVLALFAIAVLRERRQIGTLAAIGLGPRAIFATYVLRATVVGLLGSACGSAVALSLVAWFRRHPIFDHGGFAVVPVVDGRAFLQPIAVVLGATLIASVLPALRAARTDPATTLREE